MTQWTCVENGQGTTILKLTICHGKSAKPLSLHIKYPQKSYNKFHTTFSHTSKVHVKGRRLSFLSTWRPTIDDQNSSQFVWAGLGVTFLLHCLVQEKRRKEEAQLVLLVHKSKTTISLTNLCHSRPLDHLVHKSKPTILDKHMSLTTIGSSCSQEQDNYILQKLMSLTTIGSSCSQDQANYPWQTYHTHDHWILLYARARQLSLTKLICHDNWVVIDNQHRQSYNTCTHTHTNTHIFTHTIWLIFFGKSLVHKSIPTTQPTHVLHYMICISQSLHTFWPNLQRLLKKEIKKERFASQGLLAKSSPLHPPEQKTSIRVLLNTYKLE